MIYPPIHELPSVPDLPDPLRFFGSSRRVASVQEWEQERAAELASLFQHYMYGTMPVPVDVTATEDHPPRPCCDGRATLRQVRLSFALDSCPEISLLLIVPGESISASPPPVVLGLNFGGNHTVIGDNAVDLPGTWLPNGPGVEDNHATEEGRGRAANAWCVEHLIERGYALATFCAADVVPDCSDAGRAVFPARFQDVAPDCGIIAAWAWGLNRAVDFLSSEPAIDSRRIAVFGHSRNGKAALLAGATEPRIALTLSHQSGCGGAAPNRCRNSKSETIGRITGHFPLWFASRFAEFAGQEDRLPFDQNCLVALCAPRPVLLTCGDLDQWADPAGQFDVLKSATAVYRLYGAEGMPDDAGNPELDRVIGRELAWYSRSEGKHTVDRSFWDTILDFADLHLQRG